MRYAFCYLGIMDILEQKKLCCTLSTINKTKYQKWAKPKALSCVVGIKNGWIQKPAIRQRNPNSPLLKTFK